MSNSLKGPWIHSKANRCFYLFVTISACFLIGSLFFPAYYTNNDKVDGHGSAMLFFFGWSGILFTGSPSTYAWIANPFLILSWFAWRYSLRYTLILSLASVVAASSFFLVRDAVISEAPTFARITGYGTGFWLWLFSIFIFALGCMIVIAQPDRYRNSK